MKKYSTQTINSNVQNALARDTSVTDVLDHFLSMKMSNDFWDGEYCPKKAVSVSDIELNLIGNDVIGAEDIQLGKVSWNQFDMPQLKVRLSPACTLFVESRMELVSVTVNDKNRTVMCIQHQSAETIALWIIRQKQKLEGYLQEWEEVLKDAAKDVKGKKLAKLAIEAIFREGMKDFSDIEYGFIEQKRRMRIWVELPNSRLGVYIDAWWRSYKKTLPGNIESLKVLIEAHRKSDITNFFTSHYY